MSIVSQRFSRTSNAGGASARENNVVSLERARIGGSPLTHLAEHSDAENALRDAFFQR